jgi:hypothetical protein
MGLTEHMQSGNFIGCADTLIAVVAVAFMFVGQCNSKLHQLVVDPS